MSYFEVDFPELIRLLLPVRLRKPIMMHWLRCLVTPVRELYYKFTQNRNANIYTLTHNGQVVFLQAVLNDVFDSVNRGIQVVDDVIFDPLYVFLPSELHPLYLGRIGEPVTVAYPNPSWLYTRTEVNYSGYHFIVKVPVAVVWDSDRMNALIDKYRLPSRNRYSVVTY